MAAIRHANLRRVLEELARDGANSDSVQAHVLGLSPATFNDIVAGGTIGDAMARNIEWATQKPYRWLDADHATNPLA